jgi:hypothetical protein
MAQTFNDQVNITGQGDEVLDLTCATDPPSHVRLKAVNSNRVLEGQLQFLGQFSLTSIPESNSNSPSLTYRITADTGSLTLYKPGGVPGIFLDPVHGSVFAGEGDQSVDLECTNDPQSHVRLKAVNSNKALEGQLQFLGAFGLTGIPGTPSNPDGNGPSLVYRDTGVLLLLRPHGAPGIVLDPGGTVQLFHPNGGNPHVELIANEVVPDNTGGGLVNVADGAGNTTIRLDGNGGRILLPHLEMGRTDQGGAAIELTQAANNTFIMQLFENGGGGELDLFANNGTPVVQLGQDLQNAGTIKLLKANGTQTVLIGENTGNAGGIQLDGPNGNQAVLISTTGGANQSGGIKLFGPNGNEAVLISTTVGANQSAGNGAVGVTDVTGMHKAAMTFDANGNSVVVADMKPFIMPHPTQPDTDIMYVCIEGPEAAVFLRGTTRLVNGEAKVGLPDHFVHVANLDKMTVQVTALSPDSMGLAVVGKGPEGFVVRELRQGSGNYDFDWDVKCVRKGHEDFRVTRPRGEMAAFDLQRIAR